MARIRIIDDDPEVRDLIAEILAAAGYSVSTYDRIEGAIRLLENDPPDLILLDVMFPENASGGLELAMEIRRNERIRTLPIILLTNINQEFPIGLSTKDIDPQWMPVQEFLEKPVSRGELLRKVGELLIKS